MSENCKRFVVGLTGGIASGKSEVARLFAELGAEIVDADILARQCVEPDTPALRKIQKRYGSDILTTDGELNRSILRHIIFSDPTEKTWLEELLHPEIRRLIEQALQICTACYPMLVSPLLLETDQCYLVDRILVVDCAETLQIDRATVRDRASAENIKLIMASQLTRQQRLAQADDVIHNNGSLDDLAKQVQQLHHYYLTLSHAK